LQPQPVSHKCPITKILSRWNRPRR
jgi:hypothetical protein